MGQIPIECVRQIMDNTRKNMFGVCTGMITEDAVMALAEILEEEAIRITKIAQYAANDDGRSTIKKDDICGAMQ